MPTLHADGGHPRGRTRRAAVSAGRIADASPSVQARASPIPNEPVTMNGCVSRSAIRGQGVHVHGQLPAASSTASAGRTSRSSLGQPLQIVGAVDTQPSAGQDRTLSVAQCRRAGRRDGSREGSRRRARRRHDRERKPRPADVQGRPRVSAVQGRVSEVGPVCPRAGDRPITVVFAEPETSTPAVRREARRSRPPGFYRTEPRQMARAESSCASTVHESNSS